MPILLGVAGLSGAGKTTAIDFLVDQRVGQKVYFGQIVLDEIARRGLISTPESERRVRLDLRTKYGAGAFAKLSLDQIDSLLSAGQNVLVDAIFEPVEFSYLKNRSTATSTVLLAINTSFATRAARLRNRPQRPISKDELKDRDEIERNELRTQEVLDMATHVIENEDSIEAFKQRLVDFWSDLINEIIR